MTTTWTLETATARYRELASEGLTDVAAISRLKGEGVTFNMAVDASWRAAGQRAPSPEDHRAGAKWERAAERRAFGESYEG